MSSESFGSLERFVKTRGSMFLGANYGRRASAIQTWVGVALLGGSAMFGILPLLGAPPQMMFGMIGPFIAGTINLGFGIGMRKRFTTMRPVETPLTSEAKQVLLALNRKFTGRAYAWPWDGNYWQEEKYRHVGRGYWGGAWMEAAQQQALLLSDQVLEKLNAAAFEYNRVAALLAASASAQNAVGRMAGKIGAAADEGMAEALHQAGLMAAYPEASEPVVSRLGSATSTLRELADRTQALALSEPTFTERMVNRSGMQDVLDELKMEQAARSELSSRSPDEQARLTQGD